jgi:hypothetical protein
MKIFKHVVVLIIGLGWTGWAAACAICAPADAQSNLTNRLFAADVVVLAQALPDGSFQPAQLIKGDLPKGPVRLTAPVVQGAQGAQPQGTQLLVFAAGSQRWESVGPLATARADWVRQLTRLGPAPAPAPNTAPAADYWPKRLAFFAVDLENTEPLVAQSAYEEISLAPYTAMRTLKPALDATVLTRWLNAPQLAARRSLYALLLGMTGVEAQATELEKRLLAVSATQSLAEVSALFAAYLEIRGDQGLDWIERNYLANPQRNDAELQSAVMALTVHGNDGVRVTRARVVQAYAVLIKSNPARAGFAASDLGNWGRWEFAQDFARIVKSTQSQVFSSRYAMIFYLMRSPAPEAKAAMEELRRSGAL